MKNENKQTEIIVEDITIKIPNESNKEEWRDIIDYEGSYQVSNFGRIKSLDRIIRKTIFRGKILKLSDNQGYKMVRLSKNSHGKSFLVHRLVAKAFIQNPKKYPDINHIDCNKTNNNSDNLEWCSEKQNTKHAMLNNRMNYLFGEANFRCVLNEQKVKEIRYKFFKSETFNYSWLAKEYGVSKGCITGIILNKNWYCEDWNKILQENDLFNKIKKSSISEHNPMAKLNKENIIEIRESYKNGNISYRELAKKFNVTQKYIGLIITCKRWKNI